MARATVCRGQRKQCTCTMLTGNMLRLGRRSDRLSCRHLMHNALTDIRALSLRAEDGLGCTVQALSMVILVCIWSSAYATSKRML